MHEKGFLQAIIENPNDDTPRLVYSDWLEDHGDPARAEFIRIQCQRARLPKTDPRHQSLAQREAALIQTHGSIWLEDIPKWARPRSQMPATWARLFQRGFVAVLECTCSAWLNGSAGLLRRTPLQRLRIDNVSSEQLDQLGESLRPARLNELRLHRGFRNHFQSLANPKAIGKLARWTHLEGLQELDLSRNSMGDESVIVLSSLAWLCRTTKLELSENLLTDRGIAALAVSRHLANLTSLGLAYSRLTVTGIEALARSPFLTRLTELSLGSCHSLGDASAQVLASSPNAANLFKLDLSMCGIHAEGALALASSPQLARLQDLRLNGNCVGREAALAVVASPHLAGLTHLGLIGVELGDEGACALAQLPQSARLRSLDLRGNNIGPVAARALAASDYLAGLERLFLSNNPVGEARAALQERFGDRVQLSPASS